MGLRAPLLRLLLTLFVLAVASRAQATPPLDPKAVPEPLKPWTAWVLDGHEDAACPSFDDHADVSRCLWPSRLELALDDKGGRFAQSWHADARGVATLPGDAKRWPGAVTIDGKRAVVVASNGNPAVAIDRGDHAISGTFAWDSLPESLRVPPDTGLLALTLRGAAVAVPNRDARGTLWLHKAATNEEGDALTIVVHRKITDGAPVIVTTHVELHVAGKSREELLGKATLPGFVPMALDGGLPARLEPDGRLRVQVRPGVFAIDVTARSEGAVASLSRPAPDGPWRDGDEVWAFEAKSDVRVVTIEGAPSIDPQQTTLPDAWKRLPAYPMKVGDTLRFVEKRRGDADPPPNQLTLDRTLWLDFDGAGYTASDAIGGTLSRDARLTMAAPTVLGRVAIGGRDQFITKMGQGGATGVEIRQGTLDVTADSRIPGDPSDLPAVSWAHDFDRVKGTLHLPPGWRLIHASGVDEVPGTWVRHWSLLELFLALLVSIAIGRLYGARWAAVALAMLVLTMPEDGAPKWSWIVVLAAEALFRVLPAGKVKALFGGARVAAAVIVALIAIPFLVRHVREGMYPALADANANVDAGGYATTLDATTRDEEANAPAETPPTLQPLQKQAPAAPAPSVMGGDESKRKNGAGAAERPPAFKDLPSDAPAASGWRASSAPSYGDTRNAPVYDPSAIVQTGPGLPRWTWTTLALKWSGPVTAGQRVHLVLTSPAENLALAILRALLLAVVILRVFPWSGRFFPRGWGPPAVAAAAAIAIALWPGAARADVPSKELLDELQARLLRKPECLPSCATSARMALDVRGDALRARLEVDAAALTAIPLPGRAAQWSPAHVILDGKPARGLARLDDGTLWIELDPGPHQIALDGPIAPGASMQLALPLKPHRVEVDAAGWSVAGVHEDGLADDDLQLTRLESKGDDAGSALQPGALPPFVTVERTIHVGLEWQVDTRVVRATPLGAAVVLEVPLLAGESVTTADVRVVGGKAQVNLGPQASELAWRSTLDQKSPVRLVAPRTTSWFEVWRVDVGPIWHATFGGIPQVRVEPVNGARVPTFRPWPGEEATVTLVRPEGVAGQSLTIDQSTTDVTPGLRATDVCLSLSIRSSRGAEHTVTLPEGAQLASLAIDGQAQPIRQDGRKVTVPIVPGAQRVVMTWREPAAIATWFGAPAIDLGAESVNATIAIHVPGARWVLLAGGPRVGPAVLFWSLLLVLAAIAIGLGRNTWTPLTWWQWLLLAIGLSQVDVVAGAVVVGWFLALGWRGKHPGETMSAAAFDLRQIVLVGWTLAAVAILCASIYQGLLGAPEMQVEGNGSNAATLRWFVDRAAPTLPTPWMISAPLFVYRAAMLAWALWLALAILRWVKWAWGAFTSGGGWRRPPPRPQPAPIAPPQAPVAYGWPQGMPQSMPQTAPLAAPAEGMPPAPPTTQGDPGGATGGGA